MEQVALLAEGVPEGTHEVSCQTLPAAEQTEETRVAFRIMSLMSL